MLRRIPVLLFALLSAGPGFAQQQPEDSDQQSQQQEPIEIKEEVVVTATRTETRLQDQPLRVEIIDREDIEEKALMTPGSVAMLLSETSGLRVQTTAPSLGAANVRIQGLRGRYAQLLADGLPLYGSQGDSFSLLQVPPLDLEQVEVIKGAASALYGLSALGGVINLVSRRPREVEREALVNVTSRGGTDLTAWFTQPSAGNWGATLLAGYHRQGSQEIEKDGWADLAGFDRGIFRPRLFYDNRQGKTVFVTGSVLAEERDGGTLPGAVAPDGQPFPQQLTTQHLDGGVAARWLTAGGRILAVRGSAMHRSRDRLFGSVPEHTTQSTGFGELSIQGLRGRHTWVAGVAFQRDQFGVDELPWFDYDFYVPSVFAQDEIVFGPRASLSASGRIDVHSEYGLLASPRVSLLVKPAAQWILRVSAGTGAFSPTPLTEEADEAGLSRLLPLSGLRAELTWSTSVDVTRIWGPVELTGTVFGSRLQHAIQRRDVGTDAVELINAPADSNTSGIEAVGRYRAEGFVFMATYGWTRSTEPDPETAIRRDVPLTPRHAGSLNAIWENDDWGRVGVEMYYTGRQPLEDNPYRTTGRPYWLVGLLGERRIRNARLFVNAENIFDVRQTKDDPLLLPAPLNDGRWTVDLWAPADGIVINGGIRLGF
jgi:iron complex outermembrane receptor protein